MSNVYDSDPQLYGTTQNPYGIPGFMPSSAMPPALSYGGAPQGPPPMAMPPPQQAPDPYTAAMQQGGVNPWASVEPGLNQSIGNASLDSAPVYPSGPGPSQGPPPGVLESPYAQMSVDAANRAANVYANVPPRNFGAERRAALTAGIVGLLGGALTGNAQLGASLGAAGTGGVEQGSQEAYQNRIAIAQRQAQIAQQQAQDYARLATPQMRAAASIYDTQQRNQGENQRAVLTAAKPLYDQITNDPSLTPEQRGKIWNDHAAQVNQQFGSTVLPLYEHLTDAQGNPQIVNAQTEPNAYQNASGQQLAGPGLPLQQSPYLGQDAALTLKQQEGQRQVTAAQAKAKQDAADLLAKGQSAAPAERELLGQMLNPDGTPNHPAQVAAANAFNNVYDPTGKTQVIPSPGSPTGYIRQVGAKQFPVLTPDYGMSPQDKERAAQTENAYTSAQQAPIRTQLEKDRIAQAGRFHADQMQQDENNRQNSLTIERMKEQGLGNRQLGGEGFAAAQGLQKQIATDAAKLATLRGQSALLDAAPKTGGNWLGYGATTPADKVITTVNGKQVTINRADVAAQMAAIKARLDANQAKFDAAYRVSPLGRQQSATVGHGIATATGGGGNTLGGGLAPAGVKLTVTPLSVYNTLPKNATYVGPDGKTYRKG